MSSDFSFRLRMGMRLRGWWTVLCWAFGNRVVAQAVTVQESGYWREGDRVTLGGRYAKVHHVDHAAMVVYVY